MPAHDWTRVNPGIFHHFHNAWVVDLTNLLNADLLPAGYYALAEQVVGRAAPDVITLELVSRSRDQVSPEDEGSTRHHGGASVAMTPPKTSIIERTENVTYATLRKTVVLRHTADHEVVALIEIVSRANKASRAELDLFLHKAQSALRQNVHLLVVDMYPRGRLDPQGIHGALWSALGQVAPKLKEDRALEAAAYEAGEEITAYVEPFAIGDRLPEMPLFLALGNYISVPLEDSYQRAFGSVPGYWREKIEG